MKISPLKDIKTALNHLNQAELKELCLSLIKYKKDNKEFASYLLFESQNTHAFIDSIKEEMRENFSQINLQHPYFIKKGARKIQRQMNKHIAFAKSPQVSLDLILFFCEQLLRITPSIKTNPTLGNLLKRLMDKANKLFNTLHSDLQHDFQKEIDLLNAELTSF